jgi:hypothetical protein
MAGHNEEGIMKSVGHRKQGWWVPNLVAAAAWALGACSGDGSTARAGEGPYSGFLIGISYDVPAAYVADVDGQDVLVFTHVEEAPWGLPEVSEGWVFEGRYSPRLPGADGGRDNDLGGIPGEPVSFRSGLYYEDGEGIVWRRSETRGSLYHLVSTSAIPPPSSDSLPSGVGFGPVDTLNEHYPTLNNHDIQCESRCTIHFRWTTLPAPPFSRVHDQAAYDRFWEDSWEASPELWSHAIVHYDREEARRTRFELVSFDVEIMEAVARVPAIVLRGHGNSAQGALENYEIRFPFYERAPSVREPAEPMHEPVQEVDPRWFEDAS